MDAKTLDVATQAFVRALRREMERRKPGSNVVPPWEEMRSIDRQSFMKCVLASLQAAKPEHVQQVAG